jgi:biotin synthase
MLVANSVFVGDYLTTKGQAPEEDYRMIKDLGLEITGQPEWVTAQEAAETAAATGSSCGSGGCGCG